MNRTAAIWFFVGLQLMSPNFKMAGKPEAGETKRNGKAYKTLQFILEEFFKSKIGNCSGEDDWLWESKAATANGKFFPPFEIPRLQKQRVAHTVSIVQQMGWLEERSYTNLHGSLCPSSVRSSGTRNLICTLFIHNNWKWSQIIFMWKLPSSLLF